VLQGIGDQKRKGVGVYDWEETSGAAMNMDSLPSECSRTLEQRISTRGSIVSPTCVLVTGWFEKYRTVKFNKDF
jgi:hypothetical protein